MNEQVKLLIAYDIRPGHESSYQRFVMEEFLPQIQALGLTPTDAWYTAYGDYPLRMIGIVAKDLATMRAARDTDLWQTMIKKLEGYTDHLTQRVVHFTGGFQW